MLSHLAGSTASALGDVAGTATAARFNEPKGLALDGRGGMIICDYINHRLKRVK